MHVHLTHRFFMDAASAMVGPRAWIGGLFNRSSNKRNEKFIDYPLTPEQVRRNFLAFSNLSTFASLSFYLTYMQACIDKKINLCLTSMHTNITCWFQLVEWHKGVDAVKQIWLEVRLSWLEVKSFLLSLVPSVLWHHSERINGFYYVSQ